MKLYSSRRTTRSGLLARLSALIVLTAIALTISALSTPSAQAATASQCVSGNPCISDGYQTGHTITIDFYAMYRYDGYNVIWSRPGTQPTQFHIDHDAISANLTNILPYTSYTFSVQGCNTHFLAPSTCTPWSNSYTVSTVGSSADVCLSGFVWRQAGAKDFVCVTPDVRSQASYDNSQANARRSPTGGAYGYYTCRQGYVWRGAFSNDYVCVTPQTHSQVSYDNSQAIYRVVH